MRSAALFLMLLPWMANAAVLEPKAVWKNCAQDSDCVAVKGICRPATVNAVFKAEAERYYAQEMQTTTCKDKKAEFWRPADPVPRCHMGWCEMVQKD